ncbi:MAG: phospholipase D family protein [Deltaproteobacteria bacterium]|nr:MAG: phospholipase D family protein [Deltaproteobacteria bacterium]
MAGNWPVHKKNLSFTTLLAVLMAALLAACATLPENVGRRETFAYPDTGDTRLGREIAREEEAHPPGESGFHLLGNGLDAFVARAVLAHVAERSIDVQYYLYHDDLVGRLLTWQLLQAADRGVRVRLLVDDMDLAGRDLSAAALDSHPNVEVRIFNPFSRKTGRTSQYLTRMGSVTRRMHNKSFTVDSQAAILGGRNIGNEYFEADPDLAFADLDVIGVGPVARDVSTAFDRYWNNELAYPVSVLVGEPPTPEEIAQKRQQLNDFVAAQADSVYLRALRNSDLAGRIRKHQVGYSWGNAVVVYDQPEKMLHDKGEKEYQLTPQLKPYVEGVQKELIIFSPYFVPGKEGTAFLTGLVARGVQVRILTNSLASNDVSVVHAGYAKYRKALLRGGVELYEMNRKLTREQREEKKGTGGSSKASLHAKSFVFDRNQVFIGSLNLDPRAVIHNTEIGVVLTSPEIAQGMGSWFDNNIGKLAFRLELTRGEDGSETLLWHGLVDGAPETFDADPYTGFWKRLGIGFLGILPIESQL